MGTTGQSITLANSIIGVGILAMPFCFQQCGVLLAGLILISMGLVSRLCSYFLLKSAIIARRRNFEFLAFQVFGSAGKLAVELGIIGFLMGTCIAYFVVVGDLGPQIIAKMFNINQSDILRTSIMVIVSLVCVLPLGLLRNVDSLSNVSAATIGFYFCLVIKVIAEAATQLPSGEWHHKMKLWKPSGVLQCVPIFSMALFCQTQLFEIFESLPSLSLEKMNVVTKNAINICTSVYFTLGVFGYIAFCSHQISGNILMSLSPTMASDVIKLGFVMSLAFSFPLIIFPCRASLYSLLYKKVHSSQHDNIINHSIPETTFRCITVGIIAASLCVSLLIPDIELVLGLVGSTIGVLVCMVFPAACFVNLTYKNTNERVLAKAVLVLGFIILVLGTYANLQAAEDKLDKYDERYITQERIDKMVEDFFEKRGEKFDEPYLKQVPKREPDKLEAHKPSKIIAKDSAVQPPNPVPPESKSNEDKQDNNNQVENDKSLNDVLLPEKVKEDEAADKVSETHPKNVKGKLDDAKQANEKTDNTDDKKAEVKSSEVIKHEEKQKQLIETMKQHGEEQKELMQEQNEIMAEIIKNKQEEKPVKPSSEAKVEPKEKENNKQKLLEKLQQQDIKQKQIIKELIKTKKDFDMNKEVDSDEAKKIAVESIKQIASMAIEKLVGVTEKPVAQNADKKAERLEKLANGAIEQIAKKAVETIEAIKEIKENPNEETKEKIEALKDIENNLNLPNSPKSKGENHKLDALGTIEKIVNQNVHPKPSPQQVVEYVNKPVQVEQKTKENADDAHRKKHSHSADEPLSYKEGEDVKEGNLNKNIPMQNRQEIANKDKTIPRQKREVVDCTNTVTLDPTDKKICESLLSPSFDKNILPNVDLNDVLSKMPLAMHHIGRSLKNYEENKINRDKK